MFHRRRDAAERQRAFVLEDASGLLQVRLDRFARSASLDQTDAAAQDVPRAFGLQPRAHFAGKGHIPC
jgi:hypothetical protein